MMRGLATTELSADAYASAERRRVAIIAIATFLSALGAAWLIVIIQLTSLAVVLTAVMLLAMAWWPIVGLFSAFGLLLLFEQASPDPLMSPGDFLLDTIGKSGLSGVILTPIEVLLLLTLAIWFGRSLASQRVRLHGGSLGWPVLVFFVFLLLGYARGILGGGDWYLGLWEARFLFQMVVCYLLAVNVVRTRGHLQALMTIGLLATAAFAVEGAYRRLALIDTGILQVIMEVAYAHDTVIYLATLLIVILAQQIFGAPLWQRMAGPAIFIVVGYTLLATERRSGSIAVMVAFLQLAVLLFFLHRKAFVLVVIPVLIGSAVYFPVFWNAEGPLAQPARAVRSLRQPDGRDQASNMARDAERLNILATMQANPIAGVGFGRPYHVVVPMADISFFPLWNYETHNAVHWIRLKTGPLGFIAFMVLMCSALALAAHHLRRSQDRDIKVFAVFAIAGITTTLVFSYVDLGLTSGRVAVFLGTLLGALGALERLTAEAPLPVAVGTRRLLGAAN